MDAPVTAGATEHRRGIMGNGPALTTRQIDEPGTTALLGPTVAELSTVLVELSSLVPMVETEAGQRLRRAMACLNQVVVAYR